jgi:hypothetical protein
VYDHHLSQAELRATVTLHDEIDLEDMDEEEAGEQEDEEHGASQTQQQQADDVEAQQQMQQCGQGQQETATAAAAAAATARCVRSYPCRCGDSYVLRPADMQLAAQQIILPCR